METIQVLESNDTIEKGDWVKSIYPASYYSQMCSAEDSMEEVIRWCKVEDMIPFWIGKKLGDLNTGKITHTIIRCKKLPWGFPEGKHTAHP